MGRPRLAKHPKPTPPPEPEDASQEEPESPSGTPSSKADMVRAAVAEGIEKPQEGVDFIKSRFGVVMEKPMFSSYRAQIKARERKATGEESPRSRSAQPVGIPPSFGEDIKTVKNLVEQAGNSESLKEQVNQVIALHQKYGPGLLSLIDAFG